MPHRIEPTVRSVREHPAVLRAARLVAAVIGVGTGVNVVTSGMLEQPATNLFLVPDLLVVALLLAAASVPTDRAAPVLLAGLGLATGVFVTAASSYAVRGATGWGVLTFAVITAGTAALLALRTPQRIDTRHGTGPALHDRA